MNNRLGGYSGLFALSMLALSEQEVLREIIPSKKERRKRNKAPLDKKGKALRAKAKRAKKARKKGRK